jgi:hypothetical protein
LRVHTGQNKEHIEELRQALTLEETRIRALRAQLARLAPQ